MYIGNILSIALGNTLGSSTIVKGDTIVYAINLSLKIQRQEQKRSDLDEQLKEYIAEWRKQRAKEEEELKRLKVRSVLILEISFCLILCLTLKNVLF